MTRAAVAGVLLFVAIAAAASDSTARAVTRKGWFGDENCSRSKVAEDAKVGPNGQECTRKCIREVADDRRAQRRAATRGTSLRGRRHHHPNDIP